MNKHDKTLLLAEEGFFIMEQTLKSMLDTRIAQHEASHGERPKMLILHHILYDHVMSAMKRHGEIFGTVENVQSCRYPQYQGVDIVSDGEAIIDMTLLSSPVGNG